MAEVAAVAAGETRIVADLRGTAIAVIEPGQVVILDLPNLDPVAEIGIAGTPEDHDVAFVGDTGRMVVLSRAAGKATAHIVDPMGPTKLGEVAFRIPVKIASTAGEYLLVHSTTNMFSVDVTAEEPVAVSLPVRGDVTAVGQLGEHRFVLAISGVLEEWDVATRMPGRRLRLDRPLDPKFVGGNAHRLWMIPRAEPQFIDLVMLGTRSTRRVELPEPVSQVDAHANGYTLAVIGAETGSAYIVDLTRATSVKLDRGVVTGLAWVGRGQLLAVKPKDEALEVITVALSSELGEDASPPSTPPLRRRSMPVAPQAEGAVPRVVEDELPPARWTREDITERLAAWRDRYSSDPDRVASANAISSAAAAVSAASVATSSAVVARAPHDARRIHPGGWRAELASWARATQSGSHRDPPQIERGILDEIVQRLGLGPAAGHALALLYGAYLGGSRTVAALDLAAALGWDWNEALGSGAVADSGLVRWRDGRIGLYREAIAAFDERPPLNGAIVAATGSTEATVAIVVPAAIDSVQIGAWAAPTIGALLVPNERGLEKPRSLVREARIRGVAPLVRWTEHASELVVPPQPGAIVVDNAGTAASLDLPVVATWP